MSRSVPRRRATSPPPSPPTTSASTPCSSSGSWGVQVLAATQKGSAIGERVFTIGQATATPQDRSQRDLDFEYGRFYWVVDPRALPNYPAIDVLSLDTLTVSPTVRPAQIRVYRYRVPQLTGGVDPNLGGIPACGFQGPAGKTFGPVPWTSAGAWRRLLCRSIGPLDRPGAEGGPPLRLYRRQLRDGGRGDGRQLSRGTQAGGRNHLRVGRFASHDRRAAGGERPAVVLARNAAVLPRGGPGPRSRVPEGRHRAQPVGASAASVIVLHVPGRTRALDPHRPEHLRPGEPALPPIARSRGRRRSSASRTSRSPTSSRSPTRQHWDRPSWPTRSTRRRCTSCSPRVRRPSTSSGCATTPPGLGTDPRST